MKRIKNWLYGKFLPMWAKETVLNENKELTAENFQLKQKIKENEAYIRGLEQGMRSLRKINIYGEVKRD